MWCVCDLNLRFNLLAFNLWADGLSQGYFNFVEANNVQSVKNTVKTLVRFNKISFYFSPKCDIVNFIYIFQTFYCPNWLYSASSFEKHIFIYDKSLSLFC